MTDDWGEPAVQDLSIKENGGPLHELTAAEKNVTNNDVAKPNPQDHGWVEKTKYDYEKYMTREKDAPKGSPDPDEEDEEPGLPAQAQKYEWSDEYGDIAPCIESLEKKLFHSNFINRRGPKMNFLEFDVTFDSEEKFEPIGSFDKAGLHPVMLDNLKLCQYDYPTPIQAYCIPAALKNHDVIAIAQTGSGKTAAFLVPIISKLMGKAKKLCAPRPKFDEVLGPGTNMAPAEPLVLVICPTRELAVQIFDEARRLCYRSMLRPCVAYGGSPRREQMWELFRGCDILVGTPGRLMDFIHESTVVTMRRIKYTVIDEADEMVAPDWADDLGKLLSGGDANEDADHRYMMFSATFPKAARELAHEYLEDGAIKIKVGRAGSTHRNIEQHIYYATAEKKREALRDLLITAHGVRTLIFVNAKRTAEEVDDYLYNLNFPTTSIHADRTQREREDALRSFRLGRTPILVATGVSARGLDIFDCGHVINFDLPSTDHGGIHEYVHRIGRTARIGNTGMSSSFYNERNDGLAPALVKLLLENGQEVPDFLEEFKPEEGKELNFDEEEEEFAGGEDFGGGGGEWGAPEEGGDAWGGGDNAGGDDSAWGAPAAEEAPPAPTKSTEVAQDDSW